MTARVAKVNPPMAKVMALGMVAYLILPTTIADGAKPLKRLETWPRND